MNSIEITRQELLELLAGIEAVKRAGLDGELPVIDHHFGYALAKTRRMIAAEVEATLEAISPLPAFVEYERRRLALCEMHAMIDEKGQHATRIDGGRVVYDIHPESRPAFDLALAELRAECRDAIAKQEARTAKIATDGFMRETVPVQVHRVRDAGCIPPLPPAVYDALFPILEDATEGDAKD